MRRSLHIGPLLAAIVLLLAGCAQQPALVESGSAAPELVWPKAPETPRIKFLYTIAEPEDINISQGWFKKMLDYLKGSPRKPIAGPYGIEMDAEGRLYVVDTFYKAIHVFDTKKAKHYLFPEKQMEEFLNPVNIALGTEGRIYVSDSGSKLIHVFTEQGRRYQKSIGQGRFKRPTGLAVNSRTGELLVLDTPASRLLVFNEQDLSLKRVVGKESKESEGLHYPTNITVTQEGWVYITDSFNYRIQKRNPELEFISNFGAAGDGPGYFSRPKGVATDSEGHVYVADALFDNVQIFDSEGRLLLAFGKPGSGSGEFWLPNALFIDDHDRIYVSDSYNRRVQVFQYLRQEAR
jgi:DNA-binding beta-propeller fold protein YncE